MLELDQSISLSQTDRGALDDLRETGTCQFNVPELIFDLFYPGHRRRVRAVRLTIPVRNWTVHQGERHPAAHR